MKFYVVLPTLLLVACNQQPSAEDRLCQKAGAKPYSVEYARCLTQIAAQQKPEQDAIEAQWAQRKRTGGALPLSIPHPATPASVPHPERLCDQRSEVVPSAAPSLISYCR